MQSRVVAFLARVCGHRIKVLLIWSILALLCWPFTEQLNVNTRYDAYFSADDSRFMQTQSLTVEFNRPDSLWLILRGPPSWDWKTQHLLLQRWINQLSRHQEIVELGGYASLLAMAEQNKQLLPYKNHPREALVLSKDSRSLMLELVFADAALAPERLNSRINNIVAELLPELMAANIELDFYGPLALNWQYARVLEHDLRLFTPLVLALTALLLGLLVRNISWLFGIGTTAMLSLWFTLAIAGALQLPLTAISGFIPVIAITLSLAVGIHLFTGWQRQRLIGSHYARAWRHSVDEHIAPIFWGTLTTCVGFSLLMLSPSPPIQAFGKLVTFAVIINMLLSFTWLPALTTAIGVLEVQYAPCAGNAKSQTWQKRLKVRRFGKRLGLSARLALYTLKRSRLVRILSVLMSLIGAFACLQLGFNDNPLGYFKPDSVLQQGAARVETDFVAANQQIYIYSSASGALDAVNVQLVNRFARFLRKQPEVVRVDTPVDWYKASGLGQTALARLFRENSPAQLGLVRELTSDLTKMVITVHLRPTDTAPMLALEQRVKQWLTEQEFDGYMSPALGPQSLYANLSETNAYNMLLSFLCALAMVSLILYWLRRSWRLALLGLAANLLPLVWVFGYWSLNGGYLSLGSTVVIGMILGIIVDDTFHLLLRLDPKAAGRPLIMKRQLTRITPAISLTSLVLVVGFSIGVLSDFGPVVELSILSTLIIASAWFFDLLVLPGLWRRCFVSAQVKG